MHYESVREEWNRRAAQPVSAGLTDQQIFDLVAEHEEKSKSLWIDPRFTKSGVIDFARALLSAAQRDSQPDHIVDANKMVGASADARDAAILQAGAALANIAFNMAQRRLGEPLTSDDARALYNARNQWDAAIAASREA